MFKDSLICPIFQSTIAIVEFEEDCYELRNHPAKFKETAAYMGIPTSCISEEIRILEHYPQIKKNLLDAFKSFSTKILKLNNKFEISTSWITKTEKGATGIFHNHQNSFWSGVYYYDDNKDYEKSCLEFENPLKDHMFMHGIISQNSSILETVKAIKIKKNQLILFPSYIKHRIPTYYGDLPRFSLAFNIVPVGEYSQGDSTYNTNWFT